MKTVRHLNLGGEFGKPPAIEEAPRPRSEQQTAALVAALRAAAGSRSAEQVALVERWADGVAFFSENLPPRMLSHCCALLQCVSLSGIDFLFSSLHRKFKKMLSENVFCPVQRGTRSSRAAIGTAASSPWSPAVC